MSAQGVLHVPRPSRLSAYFAARLGAPVIEPSHVEEVLDRYGLRPDGGARNLRLGRRSRNVVVATVAGRKVVKLYRPQWTPDTVRYAHSILARLHASGFPTPTLARTEDGADWTSIGTSLFAVFEFLPGRNYSLSYLLRNDRLRLTATAGRTLAQLHRRLEDFVPEGSHHLGFERHGGPRRRDLRWQEQKLGELVRRSEDLVGEERALAEALIERTPELLDEIGSLDGELAEADFRRLVIHGDYGLHNLLFQSPDVAVPLDYELARLDWRINDLISVLGKHRYSSGWYDLEAMDAFLRAYAREFPLSDDERRMLPAAWRLYKLQAAVQYWNSYFETDGPARKLESALDSIAQAEWVEAHPEVIERLALAAATARAERVHGGAGAPGAEGPVVMQVTPNLEVGGAQETARTLARYLPRAGCPTVVVAFGDGPLGDELAREGVLVERLPRRRHGVVALPFFLAEMGARRRDLRRLVERHGVEVVQTQGLGTLDFLVMTLAFRHRVQVWWTIQNANFTLRAEHLSHLKWLLGPKRRAHRALYRLGAAVIDGIIAVSDETERAVRALGVGRGDVRVVCNAVDVERYPAQVDRDQMRARLGFGPADHVMTMVGTFKRQKGHAYLVEALASLHGRAPRLHVLLVGDGELRDEIRGRVRAAGLEERVRFLGTRRDVPEILAASDSFVLPSLWEGLPVALVEAMASGLPVVATAVSGTSQVVVDGATGWLVPPADADALAAAVADLLADPVRAARMGADGRRRAEAEFGARAQAETLARLFRERARTRAGT